MGRLTDIKHSLLKHEGIFRLLPLLLCLCLSAGSAFAQQRTVKGKVVDALTKENLPFAQVLVSGTSHGVVTDWDGHFRIPCSVTDSLLEVSMMGYDKQLVPIGKGNSLNIQLRPASNRLKEVNVKASRKHNRYKRKDNPAVELMKEVVAHKPQNHIDGNPFYGCDKYVKINMALDDFHPNFQRHIFWKRLPFVENYIDASPFDETPILNVFVSESMSEKHHTSDPWQEQVLVNALRSDGIGVSLQQEGVTGFSDEIFSPIDIYQNDIVLFDYHFVSPLSDLLANATYRYFITDTILLDGVRCVELSFSPVNASDYAFVGRMYIVDDSSFAVRHYEMSVSPKANLNFVHGLNVLQDYVAGESGTMEPKQGDIYARLSLTPRIKLLRSLYLHQVTTYSGYKYQDTLSAFPDSLFDKANPVALSPEARNVKRQQWNDMRPIPIPGSELFVDSFRYEFMKTPFMKHLSRSAMILATGYIPTHATRDSSRFDIGPVYNFYSFNAIEGRRFRLGGMTKAALNNQNFADGYVAYGSRDEKLKFALSLTHTFDPKKRFPSEHPLNALSLSARYDMESPGLAFTLFDQDNILMASTTRMMEYVANLQLRFQKQWKSALSLDTRLSAESHQPTGNLAYYSLCPDGYIASVDRYNTLEWNASLFFSPQAKVKDSRSKGSLTNQLSHPFSLSLEHSMGWFESFYYNRSSLSAHKIFWITPLGYLDLRLEAGKVWNRVPLPKLFFPSGNASIYFSQEAFNAMRPMEFAADQHLSLFANYHMRGLILNHIPVVRRLHLREVASFNLFWGSLSPRNDPQSGTPGLYIFPAATQRLGNLPYMEYSIGVENILKCIRIDYVRRLTYCDGAESMNGWRLGLQFSL